MQYTSDDDDDNAAPEAPKTTVPDSSRHKKQQRRYRDDDDDEADLELAEEGEQEMRSNEEEETQARRRWGRKPARPAENSDGELGHKAEADEEGDDGNGSDAVPLGNPVEVPGEGKHYSSFEYEGNIYKLVSCHPATFLLL